MKLKKYIAASMIALAGLTACSDSFLDTDYTEYLDEEAAGEAAGKNPDVFLNGMWSWMVTLWGKIFVWQLLTGLTLTISWTIGWKLIDVQNVIGSIFIR